MTHPSGRPPHRSNSSNGRGTVHRLYEVADSSTSNAHNVVFEQRQTASNPVAISSIGNLLHTITTRDEDPRSRPNFGRALSYHGTSTWVNVGGYIQGESFTLQVRSQCDTLKCSRVRQVDSTSYKMESDSSLFQEISDKNQMFEIEIERSMETVGAGNPESLNLQFTLSTDINQNVNYLILQQEKGSTQWQDITGTCTTRQQSQKVEIPVKKSSKVWVIHLKKSFSSLKHALLALIHGRVLFHILVFYMKKIGKVKVRIIGINEELYQNPKGLKTSVTTAVDDGFQKSDEIPPQLLLRKGDLSLTVLKNGELVSSQNFDVRSSNCWHDCSFSTNDLKEDLMVKVKDKDGKEQWSIDLNDILCDEPVENQSVQQPVGQPVGKSVGQPVEQPTGQSVGQPVGQPYEERFEETVDISKPEVTFDDEVCECHIPWLGRHLNKDVEKVARLLKVNSDEIDAIKQGELPETRNIKILEFWRKKTLRSEHIPKWKQIKDALENENVGRFDIIRCLQNEEEISDDVFLWLEPRIASVCDCYARVLGVPDHEVTMIRCTYPICEEKCTALLKRWRQMTPNPSVEDLIEALEHDTITKNELAEQMRKRFCEER